MKDLSKLFRVRFSFLLLSLILFFYSIIQARDFLYPVAIGMLISYLLYPFTNFLEKKRFPRILAIILSILITIVLLVGMAFFVYKRIEVLVSDFPSLRRQALLNIETLLNSVEGYFTITDNSLEKFLKLRVSALFETGSNFFNMLFTATTSTIFNIAILPVYVFLFLFYRTKFAYFILMIVPFKKRYVTVSILRDISQVAAKYMGGVFMVVVILAFLNSVGLILIGIKYAVVLGILSAIFTFIPYFGTIIGSLLPITFSLLSMESPVYALKVILFYIIIVFLEHNILTPNIVGGNVRINPFIIILSLIIAAMVWGIPGMIVIVPFMAIVKIICKHVPELRPYTFLLGTRGTRRHAIYIPTVKEIIKRRRNIETEE